MGGKDYYAILEVPKDADENQLKKAYRELSRTWHPDKNLNNKEEAETRFKEISEAYDVLHNPEKRRIYDQFGEEGLRNGGGGPPEDLFQSFFGGMGGFPGFPFGGGMFGGGGHARGPPQKRPRGPHKKVQLPITVEDMMLGCVKNVTMDRRSFCHTCSGSGCRDGSKETSCGRCNGKGNVVRVVQVGPGMITQQVSTCDACQGKGSTTRPEDVCRSCNGRKITDEKITLDIRIERGSRVGDQVVISGMSDDVEDAVQSGDLYVVFVEGSRGDMTRQGDDLYVKKSVSLKEALCGIHTTYSHPNGTTVGLTYDSILKPGDKTRVNGLGFFNKERKTTGDLVIQWTIVFPSSLSTKRKTYLGKLLSNKETQPTASSSSTPSPKHTHVMVLDESLSSSSSSTEDTYGGEDEEWEDGSGSAPVECRTQ